MLFTEPKVPVPETVRVPVSVSPVHVMFCRLVVPWTVRFWVVVFPEPSTRKGNELPL